MEINPKYRSRISVAWWSKTLLAIAAGLSVLLLIPDFDWWTALAVAGVLVVTFFEFRVHRYFLTGDPRAPDLGFRNQACFAAGIMMYGLYHAFYPLSIQAMIPPELRDFYDESQIDLMQSIVKNGFLVVGILAGASQFGLAWYYRSAKVRG